MALPTVTPTLSGYPAGVDNTQREQVLKGALVLTSGGTYATNGVPFTWNFQNAEGGTFIPDFNTETPSWVDLHSVAGNIANSYLYDPVHGTIRIAVDGTELTNGASIPSDTIGFRAAFPRGF
jgi:hypothetical protein